MVKMLPLLLGVMTGIVAGGDDSSSLLQVAAQLTPTRLHIATGQTAETETNDKSAVKCKKPRRDRRPARLVPKELAQDRWNQYLQAFGAQNLDELVEGYSEKAEIDLYNWADGSLHTFQGHEGVRQVFAVLQLNDLSDFRTSVQEIDEKRGTALRTWTNPASGYRYGTDSFTINHSGKFIRQQIVVSRLASGAAAAAVPDPAKDCLPVHSFWKHHVAAFGRFMVDDNLLVDYTKDARINLYNHADGSFKIFHGHQGVLDFFKQLFDSLHDKSDFTFPVQVVDERTSNRPGRALLGWSNPASGYLNATDTFVVNGEGKFMQQNVFVNYQRKIPSI